MSNVHTFSELFEARAEIGRGCEVRWCVREANLKITQRDAICYMPRNFERRLSRLIGESGLHFERLFSKQQFNFLCNTFHFPQQKQLSECLNV